MPNFGNVGKELAKEINEEPEVEIETEEERMYHFVLRSLHDLTFLFFYLMVKFVTDCFWRMSSQSLQYNALRVVFSLARRKPRSVSAYVLLSATCSNCKHIAVVS